MEGFWLWDKFRIRADNNGGYAGRPAILKISKCYLELLTKLAGTIPKQDAKQSKTNESSTDGGRLDIAAYLKHYGVLVVKKKPYKGCILFCLEKCLFRRIRQLDPLFF